MTVSKFSAENFASTSTVFLAGDRRGSALLFSSAAVVFTAAGTVVSSQPLRSKKSIKALTVRLSVEGLVRAWSSSTNNADVLFANPVLFVFFVGSCVRSCAHEKRTTKKRLILCYPCDWMMSLSIQLRWLPKACTTQRNQRIAPIGLTAGNIGNFQVHKSFLLCNAKSSLTVQNTCRKASDTAPGTTADAGPTCSTLVPIRGSPSTTSFGKKKIVEEQAQ